MTESHSTSSLPGLRIAIQGYAGSFHDEAARIFWGSDVQVIPCDTFREVVRLSSDRSLSEGGMMAIENSIAGSILPNYALLQKSRLQITGEVYLHVRQQLLANPGVTLADIREVHSHPMALLQCMDYLEQHPSWKLVETEDTALSAKHLHQRRHRHAAAIASRLAAGMYGLQVLVPDVHTMKQNYTRFLVLEPQATARVLPEANKASVNFHTDHSRGSLAKVLTTIAEGGVNLSKLQSFPIPGTDFQYSFHADMEFDDLDQFERVIEQMKRCTLALRIFGLYRNGRQPGGQPLSTQLSNELIP